MTPASDVTFTPASSAAQWDAAVLGRVDSVPFHAWGFLEACAVAWRVRFQPLLVRRDGRVIGGWIRLTDRRAGLSRVNHKNLLNFVGPSVPLADLADVLSAAAARDGRYRTIRERQEVRVDPALAPVAPGWRRRTGTSMVVQLAGLTDIEVDELGGTHVVNEAARRARKYGTVIAPSTADELRCVLPRLMTDLFGRQRLDPPYSADTYERAVNGVSEHGVAHALTAHVDGEPAAIAIALAAQRGEVAYEWIAADDSRFRRAGVSLAVRRALVDWAHRAGYREYDLLGGTTEGITAFKRSLGARPRNYVIYERGLLSVTTGRR